MRYSAATPLRSAIAGLLSVALASPCAWAQAPDAPAKAQKKAEKPEKKKAEKPEKKKDKKKDKKKGKDEPAEEEKPSVAPLSESLTGEAKDAYESGKLLYGDGDYVNARIKFERAYEVSQDPRLLWNMAATEKQQRRYGRVLELVERYLAEGGDKLSAQDREDAHALVETVKALVSEVTVDVNEPGADIAVDGEKQGESPLAKPLTIGQGEHAFRVSKAGFVSYNETRTLPGGAPTHIEVKLVAEVHEGKLKVLASPGAHIAVDGKEVGRGQWQGTLASGSHTLTVTARGKRSYQTELVIEDGQPRTERVTLEAEARPVPLGAEHRDEGASPWPWIAGGAVAVVGLTIAGYLLFKPKDEAVQNQRLSGTIPPGYVPLRF